VKPQGTIDDPTIWRVIHLLVNRHGVDAAVVAARKSDALRAVGDADGSDVWQRILEGIAEFWRTTPAKGERLH
jgi:hypothetical protein